MNKIIMALAATAFMSTSAFAGGYNGTITGFNEAARSVTVDSGTVYMIPLGVALPEGLAIGQSVSITTNDDDTRVTQISVSM